MRRLIALVVLLARPALAALPSVELEVPLSPLSAGPAYSASAAGSFGAATLPLAPTPSFAAAAFRGAAPLAAPAAELAAPAAAPIAAAAADPTTPSPDAATAPQSSPRTEAVREGVSAAAAAQSASADAGRAFDGTAVRGDATSSPVAVPANAPLLDRLLTRVTLEDGGNPAHRTELRRGFERMLESPTARALAERYAAEGPPSVVRFTRLPETQPTMEGGRAYFHGARAITE